MVNSKCFVRMGAGLGFCLIAGSLGAVTQGPAGPGSVCHVVTEKGSSEFIAVDTPDKKLARQTVLDRLVSTLGVSPAMSAKMVHECIPPGGTFGNPQVQQQWAETPR